MGLIAYSHGGRQGDIIYSLFACRQYAKNEPFDFYLQTNIRDEHDPSNRGVLQTPTEAAFLASILREQSYIMKLTIGDADYIPDRDVSVYINLDQFRWVPQIYEYSEIRYWYTRVLDIKDLDVFTPVFTIPYSDQPATDKLCICFTERYKPLIDPAVLKPFADQLVFIGLYKEHEHFCKEYVPVEYHPVTSLLELLQFVQHSKGWCSNISGNYAAMEASALPRILCLPGGLSHGDVRCYCPNGKAVLDNHKLVDAVEALLSR